MGEIIVTRKCFTEGMDYYGHDFDPYFCDSEKCTLGSYTTEKEAKKAIKADIETLKKEPRMGRRLIVEEETESSLKTEENDLELTVHFTYTYEIRKAGEKCLR